MTATATVLLTGFEPFGGESVNPSWEAVRAVAEAGIPGASVQALELPVVFGRAGDALAAALRATDPDVVVCVGQAGGAAEIRVERVALNLDDARIPDNDGAQPIDSAVDPDGPTAEFSTLPVKAATAAVAALGIPVTLSPSAGTFVCNHVFYRLLRELRSRPGVRGGFVHVPFGPEQATGADVPSLPIAAMADALAAVVTATLEHPVDVPVAGGALH